MPHRAVPSRCTGTSPARSAAAWESTCPGSAFTRTGTPRAAARRQGALAFAYGPEIFLGAGQRPNDLPLMAHEVAHVVQQRQAPRVQLWTPYGSDRFEREAGRAAAAVMGGRPFTIVERTLPTVQRDVIDDVIAWATDHAYAIPGFRLLTIVLGFNPLTGKAVERSAVNILSGLIEVLPGGALVTTALNKYGILEKVAVWAEQQFHTLGDIGGSLLKAISDFKASLGAADILSPGAAIDRALNLVHGADQPDPRLRLGLLTEIVNFVKDAILRPLGDIARQESGWDLLCAVLGKDPITGDKVAAHRREPHRRLHEADRAGRGLDQHQGGQRRRRGPSPGSKARCRG